MRKLMCNTPNLDLVKINAYAFDQIPLIHSHDFERNKNLRITKCHNSVVNLQKMMCKNFGLDLININAYAKLGQIPSICSQDIERKRDFHNNQGPKLCCKFGKIDES